MVRNECWLLMANFVDSLIFRVYRYSLALVEKEKVWDPRNYKSRQGIRCFVRWTYTVQESVYNVHRRLFVSSLLRFLLNTDISLSLFLSAEPPVSRLNSTMDIARTCGMQNKHITFTEVKWTARNSLSLDTFLCRIWEKAIMNLELLYRFFKWFLESYFILEIMQQIFCVLDSIGNLLIIFVG